MDEPFVAVSASGMTKERRAASRLIELRDGRWPIASLGVELRPASPKS